MLLIACQQILLHFLLPAHHVFFEKAHSHKYSSQKLGESDLLPISWFTYFTNLIYASVHLKHVVLCIGYNIRCYWCCVGERGRCIDFLLDPI